MHEPAIAAESRDKVSARRIHIAVINGQMTGAPALDAIGQGAMAVGEKRPAEKSPVSH
jgi:hypothetical protein